MEHFIIQPGKILLPDKNIDMEKWACVACDQYTSQPEYWETARNLVKDAPSMLNLILPEVYLNAEDEDKRIQNIHDRMEVDLRETLTRSVEGFVFIRRTLECGIREGLVACVDLEHYSYQKDARPMIRPSENTVESRIPPRLAVRRDAALESPHILMLVDDPKERLMGSIKTAVDSLEKLYDFDLMLGGGHIEGWAITDPSLIRNAQEAVEQFGRRQAPLGGISFAIAVGDGNHSLATAKAWWEEVKPTLTDEEREDHPARFCLVELENIHDPAILIESIHRVVFGMRGEQVRKEMIDFFGKHNAFFTIGGEGQKFAFLTENGERDLTISRSPWPLCVGSLEAFLNDLTARFPEVEVDYIHGEETVRNLVEQGAIGFLLPPFEKSDLFKGVSLGGVLPKKTFSMGHAHEKRYYLECRRIK